MGRVIDYVSAEAGGYVRFVGTSTRGIGEVEAWRKTRGTLFRTIRRFWFI